MQLYVLRATHHVSGECKAKKLELSATIRPMKKLHLSTSINAPVQKVWNAVVTKELYEQWTAAFMPGSTFEGKWEQGAEMRFLGPSNTEARDGMFSMIAEVRKHGFISIKHLGMITNGVVDTTSPAVKEWTPSFENYTFKATPTGTEFILDMDAPDAFYDMFMDMWPRALERLKEVVETGKSSWIDTSTLITAPLEKVWEYYTKPEHITNWAFASDNWEAPAAENDLRVGGRFKTVMAAKDKSAQFDFTGSYTAVKPHELLKYTLDDGRKVIVSFSPAGPHVQVAVAFQAESENSRELQQTGWQAILENFKKYVEKGT
jgi:uncharacterized protein YndB with AHSA1/START domain